jgi:phosphosulfolactate synthase
MEEPEFLDLPVRNAKPRIVGLTHVLDKGASPAEIDALLARFGSLVDVWKLGWGTAYLEPDVAEKVEKLHDHGARACVGGTLLEVAWGQERAGQCLDWAAEVGFLCVEVSNGAIGMPLEAKWALIAEASERFTVFSEVGSKDPDAIVSAEAWAQEVAGDLTAGASWVLTEGRESGTVGLYQPDGRVREEVVETIVGRVGVDRLIFEAPRREQQAWLIRRFGPDVSLGNVAIADIVGVEALRRGLRADTIAISRRSAGNEAGV